MDPVKNDGFSLTEVVCSLGLLSAAMLPLLGVLAVGMEDARHAANRREVSSMRATVRELLRAEDWPRESQGGIGWVSQCLFDEKGEPLLSGGNADHAAVRVQMESFQGLGYNSPYLESIQLTFHDAVTEALLDECVLQRARQPGGASIQP